jgi:hypothetical protein
MFGVGIFEIIIAGAICVLPAVAGLGITIWLLVSHRESSREKTDGQ